MGTGHATTTLWQTWSPRVRVDTIFFGSAAPLYTANWSPVGLIQKMLGTTNTGTVIHIIKEYDLWETKQYQSTRTCT